MPMKIYVMYSFGPGWWENPKPEFNHVNKVDGLRNLSWGDRTVGFGEYYTGSVATVRGGEELRFLLQVKAITAIITVM